MVGEKEREVSGTLSTSSFGSILTLWWLSTRADCVSLAIQGDALDRPPRSRSLVRTVWCTVGIFSIQAMHCI